jgi:ABC-type branched-subunit amino acid transport system permease subunit/ABC-type branched-subunit amino acid transport system ATPase component
VDYLLHVLVMVCLYVVLATSFNLLIGFAGLFALSHAAFYAIGAYVTAILAAKVGLPFPVPLIAAALFAAGVGFLVALPALRVAGEYLVVVTLALQVIVLQVILNWKGLTGGTDGISGVPALTFFGWRLDAPARFLPFAALVAALCFALSWRLAHSPFGRALRAMRENESATQAVGKNLLTMKVTVFAVSAALAAVAGSLFAHYFTYVGADSFTIEETIYILAMVIVGGTGNLWGSALGAAILVILPELLKFIALPPDIADKSRLVIYGLALILILRFRPQGLIPEARAAAEPPAQAPAAPTAGLALDAGLRGPGGGGAGSPVLVGKDLRKSFGGIRAIEGLDIELKPGVITGLIGPNGAGKTTAFNLLTGFLKPDAGEVTLRGRSITRLEPHRIVAAGVARSFQDLRLFTKMTVLDNVLVALPGQTGDNVLSVFFRAARVRREEAENLTRAMAILDFVELDGKAQETAENLSYAEEKLLVVARLLATGAEVLLFDEPLSGLDHATLKELFPVVRRLAESGKTVCIIEHNLDVIKGLCDVVYFLDEGRAIAVGTPDEVMTNPDLATRYFK